MSPNTQRLGIMGGMFDPVHEGHLQFAREVRQCCALDRISLVPCGTPVHRGQATASAAQRIAMLELLRADAQWLQVDARECESSEPSYTWTTVVAYRKAYPGACLYLLLGLDAFLAFDTWHRWRELFNEVHLVVAARPGYGYSEDAMSPRLWAEVAPRITTDPEPLASRQAGCVLLVPFDLPDVSSTQVRTLLRAGEAVTEMLPPAVHAYINTHRLYQ